MPVNGGWLQKQIIEAVMNGKSWNDTVLLISYDGFFTVTVYNMDRTDYWIEESGWYDHISPHVSP
jgi:phospholipase C